MVFIFISAIRLFGQENDSLPYKMYKDRFVMYADVGFNSAPFSLSDKFQNGEDKLKYKNNISPALGIGVAYKWFALRVGFALSGNLKAKNKFGETNYFDIGLKFNIKQVFTNIDLRSYRGYALKDEYKWNDSLNELTPNGIYPNLTATSISANVWYFKSKDFNMHPVLGRVGHYNRAAQTWYFKSSINFFGITNSSDIVPDLLADSTDRMNAQSIGAIDIGFIPGYAYVNRINNWQFSISGGLGGALQVKNYVINGNSRSFLGIAPRVDFRLLGGYTKPSYFIFLTTDFDVKSIKIQSLQYKQSFYQIKLVAGLRIKTKKSK